MMAKRLPGVRGKVHNVLILCLDPAEKSPP
jgi:hypothetical protein